MSISCYIVDDQRHGIDAISKLILRSPDLILAGADTDPFVALNKINGGNVQIDLLFLDIDMPDLDGVQFSKMITIADILIVYVTAHHNFSLKAFSVGAIDYLLKPIQASDFIRATERARDILQSKNKANNTSALNNDFLFVKVDSRNIKQIVLRNLIWVRAANKYIELHIKNQPKALLINSSMNKIEANLPTNLFVRIHKSTIVNIIHIDSIVGNRAIIREGPVLDIGPSYTATLYAKLNAL